MKKVLFVMMAAAMMVSCGNRGLSDWCIHRL